jgi:hypothetical protein
MPDPCLHNWVYFGIVDLNGFDRITFPETISLSQRYNFDQFSAFTLDEVK